MALYDLEFPYVIFGDTGVGKTCLMKQYIERKFVAIPFAPNEFNFGNKTITIDNRPLHLKIIDTPGGAYFRRKITSLFSIKVGGLLLYDITRRETFEELGIWMEEASIKFPNMKIMLIGNKRDLGHKRAVTTEEGKQFAKKNGLMFMEISVKTRQNVDQAFMTSASAIYNNIQDKVKDGATILDGIPDIPYLIRWHRLNFGRVHEIEQPRPGIVEMLLNFIKMLLTMTGLEYIYSYCF